MKKILIAILAISNIAVFSQNRQLNPYDQLQIQKLNRAISSIKSGYVDTVNVEQMVNKALIEMLAGFDPHSRFISKEDMKEDKEMFEGNFEGIGIEFNVLNDSLMVVNTIPGGPSAAVGLMSGDRIVEVNGKTTVGIKQNEVPKVLRGPKGTEVYAKVIRRGVKEPMNFKIIRDKIPVHSLNAAYMIAPGVGYIKISRFMATTNKELQEALVKLKDADRMILDLRGNPGGYYDQAVYVTSNFIGPEKLVVYAEGLNYPRKDEQSRLISYDGDKPKLLDGKSEKPLFGNGKLVVLVDQNSASSSEIVAGALQDWDRATIVGRRTFGKGLVQGQVPFQDGSGMLLTIAHYYTPSGRSIQRPYKMGETKDYYMDIVERYNSGEMTSGRAVVDSTQVFKTLIEKRTVYGGGGILPDVIVPLDTTKYTKYWGALINSGSFLEFIVNDLDKNRLTYLKKYPKFENFDKKFSVDPSFLESFVAFCETKGVPRNEQELTVSKPDIENYIKALLAGRLYEDGDFYRIINLHDNPEIKAALEVLNKE